MARTASPKQLGQLRPTSTTAASLFSPAANQSWIAKSLYVCNNTAGSVTFRIFHDEDGTTYDESTALYFDTALAANTTLVITGLLAGETNAGNIGVRTGTNDALTFTLYGVIVES